MVVIFRYAINLGGSEPFGPYHFGVCEFWVTGLDSGAKISDFHIELTIKQNIVKLDAIYYKLYSR